MCSCQRPPALQRLHTVRVSIVDGAERVEALLAGRVPYCQLHRSARDGHTLREVGGLNGGWLRLREDVCDIA